MATPGTHVIRASLVFALILPFGDCQGCFVPNPLRKKPVVCTDYRGCGGLVSCPPGQVPGCQFEYMSPRHQGECTCFYPADGGGPPDFDPWHILDPYHKNDAGKWVRDDDGG